MSAPLRVGQTVQDLCRQCKMVRRHTVTAAGGDVARVICDHCGSQHNYRGGEKPARIASPTVTRPPVATFADARTRSFEPMSEPAANADLETLLRRVIREEAGLSPVAPAARWRGGELVLRPGRSELQEKSWPIDVFFNKIVMIRNRLRTLEQQVNSAELPNETKVKLQSYITACYGSLTSFNILFADEEDRFQGSGG